jgi:DNA-binding XRE family transcriptional regulator
MDRSFFPRRQKKQLHPWGPFLRTARRRCGLTQGELAQKVGVSWRSVYRWEGGRSRPRARHWEAYLRALVQLDPLVAEWLVTRLNVPLPPGVVLPRPLRIPGVPLAAAAFDLALFRAAEELDVPAARLRRAFLQVLEVPARDGTDLEAVLQGLRPAG